ncbi:MAG: hypothetical protein WCV90_00795 [Candidatus Woesearchaeota archaeon]|jgi:hypothetical protein
MTYYRIKKIAAYVGLAGLLLGAYPKQSEAEVIRSPTEIRDILRRAGKDTRYTDIQEFMEIFRRNPDAFKDLEPLDTSRFDSTFTTILEVEPFQPRLPFDIGLPAILNNEYKRPRKLLWEEPPATEEVQYADPFLKILEFRMREEESKNDPKKPEKKILPYPRMGDVSLEVRTEETGNVLILQGNKQSYTPDKALEMILDWDIERVNSLLEQTIYQPPSKKDDEPLTFGGVEIDNSLTPRTKSRIGGFIEVTEPVSPSNSVEEEGIMDDYIPNSEDLIQQIPYGNLIFQNHPPTIITSPVMLVR